MRDTVVDSPGSNEIVVATGKKILLTEPESGGLFAQGDTITGGGSGATGTIISIESGTDEQFGSIRKIVYTRLAGDFDDSDRSGSGITNGTATADIIYSPLQAGVGGPWDEFTHASEATASDINITVDRTAGGAEIDLQIEADSIINADVNSAAAIAQSKLNMQAAGVRATAAGITQGNLGLAVFDSVVFSSNNGFISIDDGQLPIEKLANIPDDTVIGRAQGDSASGDVSAIPFSTIVNSGGTFTTIGSPNAIVKTHTDGSINVQALEIDSARIIDTSGTTVNFTNPGTTLFLSSQTTGGGVTNNSMTGNLNIGNAKSAESTFQTNSALAGENYMAADWTYTSFIEAPGEGDTNSTGIGIGANNGFTSADQIGLITGGTARLVVTDTATIPGETDVYDLGSTTKRYNNVYAISTSAQANTALYADLAENYLADATYETGSVLIFGGEQEVTVTQLKDDTRVAGVVSEKPGYLMNAGAEGDFVTAIALQGRVPVNVVGIVKKGDLLVTASVPGYAIVNNSAKVGTVIGKALQAKDDPGYGTIEAVVGRV